MRGGCAVERALGRHLKRRQRQGLHLDTRLHEPDEVVEGYVEQVKSVINLLVTRGRAVHEQRKSGGNLSNISEPTPTP